MKKFKHPYPEHACAFNDGKCICECYGEGMLDERLRIDMGIGLWLQRHADTPLAERKNIWNSVVDLRKTLISNNQNLC